MNIEMMKKLELKLRRLRHEEHYNQTTWAGRTACGTAACLAGHAVLMVPKVKLVFENGDEHTHICRVPEGHTVTIDTFASELLGLRYEEANVLFTDSPELFWPDEFRERWKNRATGKDSEGEKPSRIAADLLRAVVEGEVDLTENLDRDEDEDDYDYYDDDEDDEEED